MPLAVEMPQDFIKNLGKPKLMRLIKLYTGIPEITNTSKIPQDLNADPSPASFTTGSFWIRFISACQKLV